jgi:hypothetical protein
MPQPFYAGLALAIAWLTGYCVLGEGGERGQCDYVTPGVMQNSGYKRLATGLSFKRQWGRNHLNSSSVLKVISIEKS